MQFIRRAKKHISAHAHKRKLLHFWDSCGSVEQGDRRRAIVHRKAQLL